MFTTFGSIYEIFSSTLPLKLILDLWAFNVAGSAVVVSTTCFTKHLTSIIKCTENMLHAVREVDVSWNSIMATLNYYTSGYLMFL